VPPSLLVPSVVSRLRLTHLSVVLAATVAWGCGGGKPDRSSLDLEQALHGHWVCTTEVTLGTSGNEWDLSGQPERHVIEMDRYVDARAADKTWAEATGDSSWRTLSQDPTTGEIIVATWSPANPKATRERTLRLDASRMTCLERLPSKNGQDAVQRWTFVNDQSSP
jgi:hypothetical protein